ERPLDANAIADLAHEDGIANTGAVAAEGDALEDLNALLAALDDLHVDAQRIAAAERGDIGLLLGRLNLAADILSHCHRFYSSSGSMIRRIPRRSRGGCWVLGIRAADRFFCPTPNTQHPP